MKENVFEVTADLTKPVHNPIDEPAFDSIYEDILSFHAIMTLIEIREKRNYAPR